MKREEAKKVLITIRKQGYLDDAGYGYETEEHKDALCALDMAIKALEQEPVLDKIRAEIEELSTYNDITGESYSACEFKSDVLYVIDKYKAESEN